MISEEKNKAEDISLQFLEDQTEDAIYAALERDWTELRYVKVQTFEICSFAVKQDPRALEYVRDQSPAICIDAVLSADDPGEIEKLIKDDTLRETADALRREQDWLTLEDDAVPDPGLSPEELHEQLYSIQKHRFSQWIDLAMKVVEAKYPEVTISTGKPEGGSHEK